MPAVSEVPDRFTFYTLESVTVLQDELHLLGTPETKRSGLKTLNARNAFTSKPSLIKFDNAELNSLQRKRN